MSSTDKLMVLTIAIAIVIGGGIMSYIALHPPEERFTELFLLDENGTLENYPKNLQINENASIIIVVVCHEKQTTNYTTVVRLQPENGMETILVQYNFSLSNEKERMQIFNFSMNESGKFKLEVLLHKGSDPTPYATNHIWIDVRE